MKTGIPTPDQIEPFKKMKPLSSFTLMVVLLMLSGLALGVALWLFYNGHA
jgi:hypothetical protein